MSKILNFFAGILLLLSFERLDVFQEHFGGKEALLDLKDGQYVGQTFKAKHNNLSMIQFLETVDSKFKNKDRLVFHLKENYAEENKEKAKDLVRLELSGANVGTHRKLQLKFPPILSSANKKYYFYLENLGDPEFPDFPNDSVIGIGYAKEDHYKEGQLIYNDELLEGDLAFRTFYQVPPHKIIFDITRDFLARFWQDKGFFVFYFFVIAILVWRVKKIN